MSSQSDAERFGFEWSVFMQPFYPARLASLASTGVPINVVIGIDEAGRGCVLGPMYYGASLYLQEDEVHVKALGCNDSKQMTPKRRDRCYDAMVQSDKLITASLAVSAKSISEAMDSGVNLNELSYRMIETVLDRLIAIVRPFAQIRLVCDTVGPCETMRARLSRMLDMTRDEIVVQPKADADHVCVQAASVVAKVSRDRALAKLQSIESCGSGYSSDRATIEWLANLLGRPIESRDPLMPWVRTSWGTWTRLSSRL